MPAQPTSAQSSSAQSMSAQPLARLAGLLADPTRAAICLALLDGRAWTAGELAHHVGVVASTASEQLSRLVAGGLLVEERQGRHRYLRLAGPGTAALVEELAAFASASSAPELSAPAPRPRNLRESVRRSAEARARTCYDHLAGALGVALADALLARGVVTDDSGLAVTAPGRTWLAGIGIDLDGTRRGSRPLVRSCLDWTERRPHLAGVLGAALRAHALGTGWLEPIGIGRALRITRPGADAFQDLFGITLT
ncbi:ArsR/SmtB family transcription factor [Streptomyces rubellomurinus]|nr:winged helix-turn-helix domain-containing protein [Streptomyces rubellomurinus]